MNTVKGKTKRRVGMTGFAAVLVVAAVTGCGGGGSGSFVDQNGTQVVGRGEPSDDLRRAVARIITDPAQEIAPTEDELRVLRTLTPLVLATDDVDKPSQISPEYDPVLGFFVTQAINGVGKRSQFFADREQTLPTGTASGGPVAAYDDFISAYRTSATIGSGALSGTFGTGMLFQRADQTRRFEFNYEIKRDLRRARMRLSEAPRLRRVEVRGATESDRAGRVEYNTTVQQSESVSSSTLTSVSRVIRRPDRSGERRGTYTFNNGVITVRVTYGAGGIGTGTLTGSANGLPATIAVGERITSVKYADEKTIETFDLPQFIALPFNP